jgi:Zn-dependent protease with chaperone function
VTEHLDDARSESRKGGAWAADRSGWRLRLPDKPRVLEDSRLLEYRHPAEYLTLGLALVAVGILGAGGFLFRERDVLIAAVVVYLSMLFTAMQAKTSYRLQGAEVTATQFPAIYQIFEEVRQRLHAPPTRVFVIRQQVWRTHAYGLSAPYVIVLSSVLIDALELEELRYVLGHICFGHTRVGLLIGGEESALPAVLSWVATVRDLIFAAYWRAATTSDDRAGILACGDVVKAIRVQLKISVGANQIGEVRAEDLFEQADKVSRGFSRLQAMLFRWRTPIPPLIQRLEAMVEWAGLPPKPGA